jgi:hypothetical protein
MKPVMLALMAGVLAIGCGDKAKDDPQPPANPAPPAEPATAEPSASEPAAAEPMAGAGIAPSGVDIDRLCDMYASAKDEAAMMVEGEVEGDPESECLAAMEARSPDQRQAIANCVNACGDLLSVADCFDDFGTDAFPACEPQTEE